MKRIAFLVASALALAASGLQAQSTAPSTQTGAMGDDALYQTISKLDSAFFGAFNHCEAPAQLQKHASFLDPNLEFYHDKGGVTWTRDAYIDKTRQNVCGHYNRRLTPDSLQVYPIKDFGAIEEGDQSFCDIKSDKCFGEAKFLIVWRQTPGGWHVTRVFSYGHHAIK